MINQNYLWWCLLYKLLGPTRQSTRISAINILIFSVAKIHRQLFIKASHWDKQLWTAVSAFKPDLVHLSMPIGSLLNLCSFARAPFCNSSTTSNRSGLMWKHCQRHYGPRRWLLWPVILVWKAWFSMLGRLHLIWFGRFGLVGLVC